jgi:hypothetical protein
VGIEIGVVASTHQEFLFWVHNECKLPTSLHRHTKNIFTTPNLTIRYIHSLSAARDIRFHLVVLTGRYADKWSQEDIDFLHLNLR